MAVKVTWQNRDQDRDSIVSRVKDLARGAQISTGNNSCTEVTELSQDRVCRRCILVIFWLLPLCVCALCSLLSCLG